MTKRIFYEKINDEFVPVSVFDSDMHRSFPKGSHLVTVDENFTSTKCNVDPNYVMLLAAAEVVRHKLIEQLMWAGEARPSQVAITPAQNAAWEMMRKEFGDELCWVQYPSAHDCADAGIEVLMDAAKALLKNRTVKQAYHELLVVAKLANYDETNDEGGK